MINPTEIATIRRRIDCLIIDPENFCNPLRARTFEMSRTRGETSDVLTVELPCAHPLQAVRDQLRSFLIQAEIEGFGGRALVNSPELVEWQIDRQRRGVKVGEFEFELLTGFHLRRHGWFDSAGCDADVSETPVERNQDRAALIR
jgi:hypothetical protein